MMKAASGETSASMASDVTPDQRWSLERTRIERFYRQHIDADLIVADDRRRYRQKIVTFEAVLAPWLARFRACSATVRRDLFISSPAGGT